MTSRTVLAEGSSVPALAMKGIVKRFGAFRALDGVDFEVWPGTVHALLGENGAGKSTLMNCLFGLVRPDEGDVLIHGREATIASPRDAQAQGIGMVHQHFKLVPTLTVAENVFLGREPTTLGFVRRKTMRDAVGALENEYGLDVDPGELVRSLSIGAQQRVEILRALSSDITTLVLDEPTAVLTPAETARFFEVVRNFAARGLAVVLISHHLDEVLQVADEVTVLRRGRRVARTPIGDVDARMLASLIVGEEQETLDDVPLGSPGETALDIEGLTVVNRYGKRVVDAVDISVRRGEIVGVVGVAGNGQTELVEAVTGLRRAFAGRVRIGGETMTEAPVSVRRSAGMAHVPEDRIGRGMCGLWSIENNIALGFVDGDELGGWIVDRSARSRLVADLMTEFDVRATSPQQLSRRLSGGNAQKMVLAREMSREPSVIVCAEPSRGLDIAATDFVRRRLVDARDRGAGVLLVSSELDEVLQLADRIVAISSGRIVAEFPGRASEQAVGQALLGGASS